MEDIKNKLITHYAVDTKNDRRRVGVQIEDAF